MVNVRLTPFGMDVSGIVRGGDRLGVYFVEKGAFQRLSKVICDRAHSAIAEAVPSDFDWKAILQGRIGSILQVLPLLWEYSCRESARN